MELIVVIVCLLMFFIFFAPPLFRGIASMRDFFKRGSYGSVLSEEDEGQVEVNEIPPHTRRDFPFTLNDFTGQSSTIQALRIYSNPRVAQKRVNEEKAFPHTLFYGPAGLGKTTLAELVAVELGVPFISVEGHSLKTKDDVIAVIKQIKFGSIVFIDEIHQMPDKTAEMWYKVMENWQLSVIDSKGATQLEVPRFTTIGATTEFGTLLKPFRDRFKRQFELSPYTHDDMTNILRVLPHFPMQTDVVATIIRISQRTPRILKRYLEVLEDIAVSMNKGIADKEVLDMLLIVSKVNMLGLSETQVRILKVLSNAGRAIGMSSLATAVGIHKDDLTRLHEPHLIIEGYMISTSSGRLITTKGSGILTVCETLEAS